MKYTARAIIRNMAGEREDIDYGDFATKQEANSFIEGEVTYLYGDTEWDIDMCAEDASESIRESADLRERGFWLDDFDAVASV